MQQCTMHRKQDMMQPNTFQILDKILYRKWLSFLNNFALETYYESQEFFFRETALNPIKKAGALETATLSNA